MKINCGSTAQKLKGSTVEVEDLYLTYFTTSIELSKVIFLTFE